MPPPARAAPSATGSLPTWKLPVNTLEVRRLTSQDMDALSADFAAAGRPTWDERVARYLEAQEAGLREVLVAIADGQFAGYLTVLWKSSYQPFADDGVPEINDFNVVPELRRQGIGTRLMDEAERLIAERSDVAGIGVGLYADYGPAQIMYAGRGYLPDGQGLMRHGRPVPAGTEVTVNDDLNLYMRKQLSGTAK